MSTRAAVLIVDDDPFIRKLIVTTLEGVAEFELHEARDGEEAVQAASVTVAAARVPRHRHAAHGRHRGVPPDARASPAMAGAKIVMLTATAEDSARVRAREAGADFFLTKPFSPLELLRLVAEL